MKRIKKPGILIITSLLLFSCKKDKDNTPYFSAIGIWKGSLILGSTAIFINRPGGTGSFYALDANYDTARAAIKFNYNYTEAGETFHGDSLAIETSITTSRYMSGVILLSVPSQNYGAAYPFEVFKQP